MLGADCQVFYLRAAPAPHTEAAFYVQSGRILFVDPATLTAGARTGLAGTEMLYTLGGDIHPIFLFYNTHNDRVFPAIAYASSDHIDSFVTHCLSPHIEFTCIW